MTDLALFYGRNNFLFSGATGPVPFNIFATVIENLAEMAEACNDVWYRGAEGERLLFSRIDG